MAGVLLLTCHMAAGLLVLNALLQNYFGALRGYHDKARHIRNLEKSAIEVDCDSDTWGNQGLTVFLSCPVTSLPDLAPPEFTRRLLTRRDAFKGVGVSMKASVRGFTMVTCGKSCRRCEERWMQPADVCDEGALTDRVKPMSYDEALQRIALPRNLESSFVEARASAIWVGGSISNPSSGYYLTQELRDRLVERAFAIGSDAIVKSPFFKLHDATEDYPIGEHVDLSGSMLNVNTDGQSLETGPIHSRVGDVHIEFTLARPTHVTIFARQVSGDDTSDECKLPTSVNCAFVSQGQCYAPNAHLPTCRLAPAAALESWSKPSAGLEIRNGDGFILLGHMSRSEAVQYLWDEATSAYSWSLGFNLFLNIFSLIWNSCMVGWAVGLGGESRDPIDILYICVACSAWAISLVMLPITILSWFSTAFGMFILGLCGFCCCCFGAAAREKSHTDASEPLLVVEGLSE